MRLDRARYTKGGLELKAASLLAHSRARDGVISAAATGQGRTGHAMPEAHHTPDGRGSGQDTVEGLRDLLQEVLDRLAKSRRRRDPVTALKIACKEACHWFSTEKGPARNKRR